MPNLSHLMGESDSYMGYACSQVIHTRCNRKLLVIGVYSPHDKIEALPVHLWVLSKSRKYLRAGHEVVLGGDFNTEKEHNALFVDELEGLGLLDAGKTLNNESPTRFPTGECIQTNQPHRLDYIFASDLLIRGLTDNDYFIDNSMVTQPWCDTIIARVARQLAAITRLLAFTERGGTGCSTKTP